MPRVSPMLFRGTAVTLFVLTAVSCGDADDDAAPTSVESSETTTSAEVVTTESTTASTVATTEAPAEETTTTETSRPTTEDGLGEDEVGQLCAAYLESITPAGFESGLAELARLLGDDAPTGVLDALDTLQDPDNDIEAFFTARNSIDGYVLPICNERFRSNVVPEPDDAAAAAAFVDALRNGDRARAERLAPTNVIVQFDWNGYPELSATIEPDNSTMSMVLEPTVTVFCQIDGGAVEFCAFGE